MALDPAHLAATTSAIATVIFSKALEKSGEHMGDAVYQRVRGLVQTVREQFQQDGSLETFTHTQDDPSEQNLSEFTNRLANLISENEAFAAEIEDSWLAVSENDDFKKLLSETDLENIDWSSHPLSVKQFAEDAEPEEPVSQPLKVETDPQASSAAKQ